MKIQLLPLLVGITLLGASCGKSDTYEPVKPSSRSVRHNLTPKPQILWTIDEKTVQGEKNTNGWSGVVKISNRPWSSVLIPPVCSVHILNITTNKLYCWVGFYGETYSRIELLDSNGEPVETTDEGKAIGARADDLKIKEMIKTYFEQYVKGRARTPGYFPSRPGENAGGVGFSLPQLFKIKKPGEYTLKIKTCTIQKIGGEYYDPDLKIIWVPEITIPIQLRASQ